MKRLLEKLNLFFENTPDRMIRHRKKTWLVFSLLSMLTLAGVPAFKLDMSMESYFRHGDPVKTAYDQFRYQFGSDETVYIVYRAKDGDIFSTESLKAVQGIQDDLLNYRLKMKPGEISPLDHLKDVKTILNVQFLEAGDDLLLSRNFIGSIPRTDADREVIRKEALNHPDYPLVFLSKDSQYGGIIIRTDFSATAVDSGGEWAIESRAENSTASSGGQLVDNSQFLDAQFLDDELEYSEELPVEPDGGSGVNRAVGQDKQIPEFRPEEMEAYTGFMQAVYKITSRPAYADAIEIHPVGNPVLMDFFLNVIIGEMKYVFSGLVVLIMLVLYIMFRSFSAVVWPIVIIVFSVLYIIGLLGWTGAVMTPLINLIIFLVLSTGVADVVHIMSGYIFFRNKGADHKDAMRSVFKKSGLACMLTSLTTAVGMTSLVFVPIVPVKNFGIFSAIGVLLAFILTVFLLPVMLDLWNPFSGKKTASANMQRQKKHIIQQLIIRFEPYVCKQPFTIISFGTVFILVMIYGLTLVRLDSDMMKIIKDGYPIKDTYNLVDKVMMGTRNMEIIIDTGVENGLKKPQLLNRIETLQQNIEKNSMVKNSSSIVNIVKDSFRILNEGQDRFYVVPQDERVLAQTLFMFSNANPADRRLLVSDDFRWGHITINTEGGGSARLELLFDEIQKEVDMAFAPLKEEYPNLEITLTGSVPLMVRLMNYISRSQVESFSIAFIVISILMILIFGSKKVGLIAMLPNAVPVFTLFGIMGYEGIALDVDTLLAAPIVIGLAVDDTIHFITHFRAEVLKDGDIRRAISVTVFEVGQAMIFTTVILSAGFLVFLFSSHQGLSNVGLLSSIAIFVALVSDLFLLPSLLVLFKADFNYSKKAEAGQCNNEQAGFA